MLLNSSGITRIKPSILDCLITDMEGSLSRVFTRKDLINSVRMNLEWILFCRSSCLPEIFDQPDLYVFQFGIMDLIESSYRKEQGYKALSKRISHAISSFEPRLRNIQVNVTKKGRSIEIIIEAVLIVEPIKESIKFITVVGSGHLKPEVKYYETT